MKAPIWEVLALWVLWALFCVLVVNVAGCAPKITCPYPVYERKPNTWYERHETHWHAVPSETVTVYVYPIFTRDEEM